MKVRTAHLAILMIGAMLAGCKDHVRDGETTTGPADNELRTRKEIKESRKNDRPETTHSRFENLSGKGISATQPEIPRDTPAPEYYTPVEGLTRANRLNASPEFQSGEFSTSISPNSSQPIELLDFFENGLTSNGIYLSLTVDNDLFDYTDYYYTSGQSLEFFHPAISASPLARFLPSLKRSYNFYSITLFQNLYTPRKLTRDYVLEGDRPFAAFLCLGHRKYSLQPEKRMRLETHFDLGVIGPGSLGKTAQDIFHSQTPIGWMYQVSNDIVANYLVRFDKGLLSHGNLDLAFFVGGQAGTLYDNLIGGLHLEAGKTNGRYRDIFLLTPHQSPYLKRLRYYFSLDLENKAVFYDATLQGGMFNRGSVYIIRDQDLNRYVFTGRAGFGIGLGPLSLEAEQVYLTPEFDGGRHHFWFRLKMIAHLN